MGRELLCNVPTDLSKSPRQQEYHRIWLANLETIAEAHARAKAVTEYAGQPVTLFDAKDRPGRFQTHWELQSMAQQQRSRRRRQ